MRPDEVTIMRLCDIDRSGKVWIYTPRKHKTEHLDLTRTVPLGWRAQAILRPWFNRGENEYLFSPREVVAARVKNKKSISKRKIKPREHYDDDSYRRAVVRACQKAGVPKWTPNQLRHSAATKIRKKYNLEAAKAILGHTSCATTEDYAEKDQQEATRIMRIIG